MLTTPVLIILISVLVILIVLSAFFSAAETAYSSVSRSLVETEAKKKKRSALLIKKHYKSFGWTLATILIFNNLVNISSSALVTFLFTKAIGAAGVATIVSTFVMTPIIVVFGEIVPKLLAKKYAYGYLKKIALFMEILNWVFFPITYPLSKFALQSKITNSETELKNLIHLAKKEGVLDSNEATLTSKALDFDSIIVSKIMVKKSDITFIKHDEVVSKAIAAFKSNGFSRMPVQKNGKFIGVLILKDIITESANQDIVKFTVPIGSISKNVIVSKALETIRTINSHMLLVTSSSKSNVVVGILTVEDIIEELIGEIYDEHDSDDSSIRQINHHKWLIHGSKKMINVIEELHLEIELENKDHTLKQWVQSRINRNIKNGLKYNYKNKYKIHVVSNAKAGETIFELIKR
ncbi:MAG: HlyC/CorC family transporter [Mycoplasmataceae bacterium]|nr:HlyC/CorC family transporter [Mycoplasmataceae bacterium]